MYTAVNGDKKDAPTKAEGPSNAEPGQPLAPPPKPGENGGDYFSSKLSLEPNPFEESFGNGGTVETPGGTKLPSVAALTSPSSLLPGNGNTPFNWGGGSLRTGPLSPAMLSGPTGDYFGDTSHTLRGGFTPNESSLRTGLTPGGSGSMFPAPSPNSQALFNQLAAGGGATPGTLDFQRTALTAAAKASRNQAAQQSATSQPQEITNGATVKTEAKPVSGGFDPHDNDAANGLFMLAQGAGQRNGAPPANQQFPVGGNQPVHAHPAPANPASASPQMNGTATSVGAPSVRGVSEAASGASDEMEQARPATRAKGKRGSTSGATNGRRKAEDAPAKMPANKKAKTAVPAAPPSLDDDEDHTSDEDDDKHDGDDSKPKSKMTDEEKRKNFLERNRYVVAPSLTPLISCVILCMLTES
jgi:ATF/CREB family transcription factor